MKCGELRPSDHRKIKNPSRWLEGSASGTRRLAAADVRCLEALRPFQQVELDGLALVESAIAVFLDGGEVDENIFTRGPLDETVSFCPVEPLYCTLLSHKVLLSPLLNDLSGSLVRLYASNCPPQKTWTICVRRCPAARDLSPKK